MELAPIWTMMPMLNPDLMEVPLQLLSPDASEVWDTVTNNRASLKYGGGTRLDHTEKPGGLWLKAPNQKWTEAKMANFLAGSNLARFNDLIFVTTSVARLFDGLNLGDGRLTPTPVLRPDMQTPFDASLHLLEYPNHRDTVDRDKTDRCRPANKFDPNSKYQLPLNLAGRDVIVHRGAEAGPDLWFDPMIISAQFASDRAAMRLIDAGLRNAFDLNPCKFL